MAMAAPGGNREPPAPPVYAAHPSPPP